MTFTGEMNYKNKGAKYIEMINTKDLELIDNMVALEIIERVDTVVCQDNKV